MNTNLENIFISVLANFQLQLPKATLLEVAAAAKLPHTRIADHYTPMSS